MSPMAEMSQAIRLVLEKHGATLKDIPDDVLDEFSQIVWAFYADILDERTRRHLDET